MEGKEVIIGTYENLILGYRIDNNLDGSLTLETTFTDDSHRGALRCMSISPSGVLASSSTDDSVRLHSLHKRKEVGGLFEHSGTVNSIVFFQGGHMFTASEDGRICMWKCKNWELLRTLKGHKSHVMSFTIHPSGKLGLSVGSDRSLLTWDLVTGKLAFQRKTTEVAQQILFTSDGNHYILVHLKQIDVCCLQDTKTVQEIPVDWRINTTCFVEDNILAVGGDDQQVLLIDILTGQKLMTLDLAKPSDLSFSSRVKCISVVDIEKQKFVIVVTASGNVKIFRVSLKDKKAEVVLFFETGVRATCMAIYNPANELKKTDLDIVKVKEIEKAGKAERSKTPIEKARLAEDDDASAGNSGNDDADDTDSEEEQERHPTVLRRGKKRKITDQPLKSSKKKGKVDPESHICQKKELNKKKPSTKKQKNPIQTETNINKRQKKKTHPHDLKKKIKRKMKRPLM